MTQAGWFGTFALAGIAAAVLPGLAAAQGPAGPGGLGLRADPPSFETLDADGDGKVTIAEFRAHAEAGFAEADADGDGLLTAQELAARAEARAAQRIAAMIERLIQWRDTDGDGALSAAELSAGMGERLFARTDVNRDGVITAEEFEAARSKREKRAAGRRGKGFGQGAPGQGG